MICLRDVREKDKGFSQNFQDYHVSDEDVRNVTIAGLMHDLGHGPFSHLFDREVVPILVKEHNVTWDSIGGHWEHEDASEMLFNYMIEQNLGEDATEADEIDPKLISRLIKGEHNSNDEKLWMFEIIANKRNSFDVDKLDYLCRDNYHVGLNH